METCTVRTPGRIPSLTPTSKLSEPTLAAPKIQHLGLKFDITKTCRRLDFDCIACSTSISPKCPTSPPTLSGRFPVSCSSCKFGRVRPVSHQRLLQAPPTRTSSRRGRVSSRGIPSTSRTCTRARYDLMEIPGGNTQANADNSSPVSPMTRYE